MLIGQWSGNPSGVNYDYAYTYSPGGNLATRVNRTPNPNLTRTYVYDIDDTPNDGRHYHALESISGDGMVAAFVNDASGNMTTRTVNGVAYTQAFDVENRLTSVTVNGQTTAFYYDADGSRTLTVQPNGTKVYTPFPDYEETVPVTGGATKRVTFSLAGQLIAVLVTTDTTNNYYYAYSDHLGNITGWSDAAGVYLSNSIALHGPYGAYRFRPPATINPGISDRGFTGHQMNNSATNDLGLIYMNARYYLPEIGRFISADTIVPEPKDPQTYNRYSYALNSPVNYTDPTGHCTSNYEAGSQDMVTCLSAWNSVANYLYGAAFGPGGSGNFPNETVSDWLANADIGMLENLMGSYGIGYGYTYTSPAGHSVRSYSGAINLGSPEARAKLCQYWQSCYVSAVTREEMRPDAMILPGGSGSLAGVWFGVVGEELVWNFRTGETSLFGYSGQGAGVAIGTDAAPYFGLIWNLESNNEYAGDSSMLSVDFAPFIGGQAQLFWESKSVPFTGNTWGISIGPSGGLSVGVAGAQTYYVCQLGCR